MSLFLGYNIGFNKDDVEVSESMVSCFNFITLIHSIAIMSVGAGGRVVFSLNFASLESTQK